MLNLKQSSSRRGLRRQRQLDLSIITGLPQLKRRCTFTDSSSNKRVRIITKSDEDLRQQLLEARKEALLTDKAHWTAESDLIVDNLSHLSFKTNLQQYKISNNTNNPFSAQQPIDASGKRNLTSQYFHDPETPGLSSFQSRIKTPAVTLRDVPSFITQAEVKKALHSRSSIRNVLKESSNDVSTPVQIPRRSETEYWTSFIKKSDQIYKSRNKGRSLIHEVGRSKPATIQGWSACSSLPITRETASMVQQEVASMTGTSSTTRSSSISETSSDFDFWKGPPLKPTPFLINSIKPPSETGSSFLSFSNQNDQSGVMVGEWIGRERLSGNLVSRKYSVAQLVDILCGDANPTEAELAGQIFQPDYTPRPATSKLPALPPFNRQTENLFVISTPEDRTFSILPGSKPTAEPPLLFSIGTSNNESFLFTEPRENETSVSKNDSSPPLFNLFDDSKPDFNPVAANKSDYFPMSCLKTPNRIKPSKSVSFLTDSQNNISVKEYTFNPFTQSSYFSPPKATTTSSTQNLSTISGWNLFQTEEKENQRDFFYGFFPQLQLPATTPASSLNGSPNFNMPPSAPYESSQPLF